MRRLWPVALVLATGVAFLLAVRLTDEGPRSPLWFSEYLLHLALGFGLWRVARGAGGVLHPAHPGPAIAALSWAAGMIYETSLTVDGTGIGGMHPDTATSFLVAQPDYVMIALALVLATRHLRLDAIAAVWLALGMSLTEGLIFTGVLTGALTGGDAVGAVLATGYYTLAYAGFVALPLAIFDPAPLWRQGARRPNALVLCLTGFAAAFAIRVLWGLSIGAVLQA